jgi:hypothetical protein
LYKPPSTAITSTTAIKIHFNKGKPLSSPPFAVVTITAAGAGVGAGAGGGRWSDEDEQLAMATDLSAMMD